MRAEPDSTMSELAISQQLRFVIDVMDGLSVGIAADSYQIRQVDQAGNTILSLIVPSDSMQPIVLGHAELFISLNPAGEVSISSDSFALNGMQMATTDIDDLVKKSVNLQMLEDEPNAAVMLQTLKKRLITSLAAVDEAISNLRPK